MADILVSMTPEITIGYKPGDLVHVHGCGSYYLPKGLPEGAEVLVLSFDQGYYEVAYQGRAYSVPMECLEKE